MHIRDKQTLINKIILYIDKTIYKDNNQMSNEEQFKRANEFFQQFPKIDLQAEKVRCPQCKLLHKVYCLKCRELLVEKTLIPKVELPLNLQQLRFKVSVFIIHHDKEKHQKSSAIPAKFLSDQVEVKDFPCDFEFDEFTYVLYPHQNAKYIKELSMEELQSIKKLVAIDCIDQEKDFISYVALNWINFRVNLKEISQSKIYQIRGLLNIFLEIHVYILSFIFLDQIILFQYDLSFINLKCLATIEAIYYSFQEYNKAMNCDKDYSNLLFFYKYTFQQMQEALQKEVGNSNVYEKIEQKKQRRLQSKQIAKQEKSFKRNFQ